MNDYLSIEHGESFEKTKYHRLGKLLRDTRIKQGLCVSEIAQELKVAPSFVYLVEQGRRKPKDGYFGNWSEAYGVSYIDMWKTIGKIPMDLVGSLKEDRSIVDPFIDLTESEKAKLVPFINYVRWDKTKIT